MSKLTARGRKRIAGKNFVFPKGTKAAKGEPKFPIHDRSHARSALARAGQKKTKLTKTERCTVVKKVCKKYPTMGLCETGKVSAKSALKRAGCGLKTKKKAVKRKAPARKAVRRTARRSSALDVRPGEIITVNSWLLRQGFTPQQVKEMQANF